MIGVYAHAMPHIPPQTPHSSKLQKLFRLSRTFFGPTRVPSEAQIQETLKTMVDIPLSEFGFEEKYKHTSRSAIPFPTKYDTLDMATKTAIGIEKRFSTCPYMRGEIFTSEYSVYLLAQ